MVKILVLFAFVIGLISAIAGLAARAWRRNPRLGTAFVNSVVNPALMRRGLSGGRLSEIGTIEHVGRRSGVHRLSPVHPEMTPNGFRVLVPLGARSQWAQNVLAAGGCRLYLHETVFELDEPRLVGAAAVDDLPRPVRRLMAALGFEYLTLRTFSTNNEIANVARRPSGAVAGPGSPELVAVG